MGLLANNFRDTLGCYRFVGATLSNNANPSSLKEATHRTGATRNLTAGTGVTNQTAGYPYGYRDGGAWSMPQKAGALSSHSLLTGSGDITASILAVKLASAGLTGSGNLAAVGGLIVNLIADLVGSGEISNAELNAFLQLVASIGGSGDIDSATLTGLGALVAALLGEGTAAESILTGLGNMAADITVTGTGLTTSNVGQAVWSALAAANDTTGTMGEKLNDAGSAANPWTEVIESGYTAEEILRMMAAVLMGKVSGAGTGTETFKGIDGTTDRVIVEATEEGNRTSVTLDGA